MTPVRVHAKRPLPGPVLEQLERAARAAGPLKGPLEIHIVSDSAIRRVNRDRLGHDWSTDVCTFPMNEPFLWGELVVSADTARREARKRGLEFEKELALYVIHGVLHLKGMDDTSPAKAKKMRAGEERAMKKVFGSPKKNARPK